MSENLMCPSHKTATAKSRAGYEAIEWDSRVTISGTEFYDGEYNSKWVAEGERELELIKPEYKHITPKEFCEYVTSGKISKDVPFGYNGYFEGWIFSALYHRLVERATQALKNEAKGPRWHDVDEFYRD